MARAFIAILIFGLACASIAQQPGEQIAGFTAQSAPGEANWEQRFKSQPDPQRMRANMERLSAHPHHVGSPYDKENAEWILAQYKQWGWDAHIEEFEVLFPTPKLRLLEMIAPSKFTAKLEEPAVAVDPTSKQKDEQLPTYNAYSPDGDVTAPLVYVNYGVLADYDELARHGVSVKGAIVIARYGQSWRGIKPKLAAEHGAIGCIIYSDPADDGFTQQLPFPKGPMRPPEGAQRGSVLDASALSRRSAYPGSTRDQRRQAAQAAGCAIPCQNSSASYLLCRRATPANRPRRPGRTCQLARSAAAYLPHRPWAGEGSFAACIQLGPQTRVRRDRDHARR